MRLLLFLKEIVVHDAVPRERRGAGGLIFAGGKDFMYRSMDSTTIKVFVSSLIASRFAFADLLIKLATGLVAQQPLGFANRDGVRLEPGPSGVVLNRHVDLHPLRTETYIDGNEKGSGIIRPN
jgi:hypothetical protein